MAARRTDVTFNVLEVEQPRVGASTEANASRLAPRVSRHPSAARISKRRSTTATTGTLSAALTASLKAATPEMDSPRRRNEKPPKTVPRAHVPMWASIGGSDWVSCDVSIPGTKGSTVTVKDTADTGAVPSALPPTSLSFSVLTIQRTQLCADAARTFALEVVFSDGASPVKGALALRAKSAAHLKVVSGQLFDAIHRVREQAVYADAVAQINAYREADELEASRISMTDAGASGAAAPAVPKFEVDPLVHVGKDGHLGAVA